MTLVVLVAELYYMLWLYYYFYYYIIIINYCYLPIIIVIIIIRLLTALSRSKISTEATIRYKNNDSDELLKKFEDKHTPGVEAEVTRPSLCENSYLGSTLLCARVVLCVHRQVPAPFWNAKSGARGLDEGYLADEGCRDSPVTSEGRPSGRVERVIGRRARSFCVV